MALAPSPTDADRTPTLRVLPWLPEDCTSALAVLAGSAAPDKHAHAWRIPLPELGGSSRAEFWSVAGTHRTAVEFGELAAGRDWLVGWLSVPETADLAGTIETAYRALVAHGGRLGYPHLARVWNFLADINAGDDDDERYKRFCVGRARVIAGEPPHGYAAATAIGIPHAHGRFELMWLATRRPPLAIENPRQISAWSYPRNYGPVSPGFSRAMLIEDPAEPLLLISGTAAIVGHASIPGDTLAQLTETLANLQALIDRAGERVGRTARLGPQSLLRVYLREPGEADMVRAHLTARLGADTPFMLLHGDICRRELSIEIEAVQRYRA